MGYIVLISFILTVIKFFQGEWFYFFLGGFITFITFLIWGAKAGGNPDLEIERIQEEKDVSKPSRSNVAYKETASGYSNTLYDSYEEDEEQNYTYNTSNISLKRDSQTRDDEYYRKKQAEDDSYFYRNHDGPAWKVDAADDELGRSTREREYENEKYDYEPVCDECRYTSCRCCSQCNSYPCECCSECGEANCRCCNECDTYPCRCCSECDSYPCRCCNECDSYPCRCCSRCDSYPCECCDGCGEPDRYCRCCDRCGEPDRYCRCD